MGTEVLRPQDCLIRTPLAPAVFPRRRNGVARVNRKQITRSDRRSPDPNESRSKQIKSNTNNTNNNNSLVLGQVKILKRGESLQTIVQPTVAKYGDNGTDMAVYGTGRLGPDPKTVTKQVRFGLPDVYAGSAFSMSPSPSSLPLPSFFRKVDDESATRDLRRLLRLD